MAPMDLFVSQLSCELSLEARVDAMNRLNIVADAMGTEATLSQLIPYLSANILADGINSTAAGANQSCEEDEILLLLAKGLGQMVPHLVPGPRAMPMMVILEKLAGVEETVVRDKAVESINKIVPLLYPTSGAGGEKEKSAASTNAITLLAMAKRLVNADWFTSKVSASGVLPIIYTFCDRALPSHTKVSPGGENGGVSITGEEARRELRQLYKELSEDDTPMVRRGAAKNLGKFAEAVAGVPALKPEILHIPKSTVTISPQAKPAVLDDVVPLYQLLCKDEQDSVRLLAVSSSGSVGRALGMDPGLNADLVMPIVRGGCSDLSWRVRHDLAKNFSPVSAGLGFHFHSSTSAKLSELFLCYVALLQDMEAEVRHSAVTNVAYMTYLGGSDLFMQHIAPLLPSLAGDPVMEVRSKLALAMMDCVGSNDAEDGLGERPLADSVILQVLRPLLEGFLNDEFAEVQLHVLNKLSRVAHLFSKMDVVVNAIMVMTKAQNWRVRESVASLLPHLAEAMGVDFFKEHLLDAWMKLLMDHVCQVRMACVAGMAQLLTVAGATWFQKELLPLYKELYNENTDTYLTRITILSCYAGLSRATKTMNQSSSLKEETLNMLLRALEDPVANVRIVASRGLAQFARLLENDSLVTGKIKPALQDRAGTDDDVDVRYFAEKALEAC